MKKNTISFAKGSLFIVAVLLCMTVTPVVAHAAYTYGNSGADVAPLSHFAGLTGLAFGPAEQYVTGGTNQFNAWIKNTSNVAKTIQIVKFTCRCQQALGLPYRAGEGQCQYYWTPDQGTTLPDCNRTNETIVLGPQSSYLVNQIATQYNSQACGSFQQDYFLDKIDGVPAPNLSPSQPWAASFANLVTDCPTPRPVTCSSNSQCGTDAPTGNPYCSGNDVYQTYKTYTCNNPGTTYSTCTNYTTPRLQTNCTSNQTCSNGSCTDRPIVCSSDSQCGTNLVVGSPYCSGNGVYQTYKTFTCNNPGTAYSSCSNYTASQLQTACAYGQTCANGSCTQNQANLVVSCSANPSTVNTNQNTTFTGSATGGSGNYTYQWSAGCSGVGQTCSKTFPTSGVYTALLAVTSGTQTQYTSCNVMVNQVSQPVQPPSQTCPVNTTPSTRIVHVTAAFPQITGTYQLFDQKSATVTLDKNSIVSLIGPNGGQHSTDDYFRFSTSLGGSFQKNYNVACDYIQPESNPIDVTQYFRDASRSGNYDVTANMNFYDYCGTFASHTAYDLQITDCIGQAVICSSNSQCGTNALVGSPYCSGNAVYQMYKTYTCNNPGTSNSSCSDSTAPQLQNNCTSGQTCANGSCTQNQANLVVSCSASPSTTNINQPVSFNAVATGGSGNYIYQWSAACSGSGQNCQTNFNNQGVYTALLAVTSGTQTQYASCNVTVNPTVTPPTCSTNAQCGTNALTGSPYCSGNAVYQNYKTYTCNNPGTSNSSCSDSTAPQLQNNCTSGQTCANGSCTQNQANLVVSCSATPATTNINQQVGFNATATGGSGSYTYQWSAGCSGVGQTCSATYTNSGIYTALLAVTSGTQTQYTSCNVTVSPAVVPPTCSTNAQCGTNALIGSPYCQNGDVYQNFKTFTCNNPGTANSTCSDSTAPQLKNNCTGNQICSSGACTTQTITCSTNAQCGTNALVGSAYCSGNSVFQNFKTFTCNNPGTAISSCSDSTAPQSQSNCATNQTCSNGTCSNNPANLVVSCTANPATTNVNQQVDFTATATGGTGSYTYQWSAGCSGVGQTCAKTYTASGVYTALIAVTSGTQTQYSSCNVTVSPTAVTPTCSTNAQCGTNALVGSAFCQNGNVFQNYKTFTCNNPGTATSSCSDSTAPQQQTTCTGNQTCSNGACTTQNIACSSNSQCGTTGPVGSPFCSGNGVYQNYTTSICNNPGTTNSSCSQSTNQQLVNNCLYGQTCSSGSCTTVNTCVAHATQRCIGNNIYWFDSCGAQQEISQSCGYNQTCSGTICTNTTSQTPLTVTKEVQNVSTGSTVWYNYVNAVRGNTVLFRITVYAPTTQNNVIVKDIMPAGISYQNNLTLNGVPNSGNILSGLYVGNMSAGQTIIITYRAYIN